MATIFLVSGIHTPNTGREIWNDNFTNLNTEVEVSTSTIAGVGGSIVGTTQAQVLTNKTLVSSNRGGSNTISISRKDLESSAFFLVVSDSGTVSDMDVSAGSAYSLQILGGNGVSTSVSANVLYVKPDAACIMNESSQTLCVNVSGIVAGYTTEVGGNLKVNNYLGVGAGLAGVAGTVIHVKDTTPTVRIEGTGTTATLSFYKSAADVFKISTNLDTATTSLNFGATNVVTLTSSAVTVEKNTTFNGATNTVTNDLEVTGTLTAGAFVGVATDVVINNGPVTISGGWTFIDDGEIAHDKLATMTAGNIIIGNGSSIPTSLSVSGDVTLASDGELTVNAGVLEVSNFSAIPDNTILGGTGTNLAYLTCNSAGHISFERTATSMSFTIDNNVITNAMVNSSAAIDMDKTAFTLNIAGLVMNGNTLEMTSNVPSDFFFRSVPVGTIIPYAGTLAGLSPTGVLEPVAGWLFCNGSTISIGEYPDLYTVLGSAWGGAGVLPDLVGAFLRGIDPGAEVDPDAGGRTGGDASEIGSYQADAYASHRHDIANYSTTGTGGGSFIGTFLGDSGSMQRTLYAGGDETRPLNYGVAYLIKY
jgi:microcystin-dependent protein